MKLSPETKHILMIGGALVLAVVLGIVVYKKYEANSQATQAANDQGTQDELAYLETLMGSGGDYGNYYGDTSGESAITLPATPASSMSLADELQQIESAFGFGTMSNGSSTGSTSSNASSSNAGAAAAQNTHNLGSGTTNPSTPRAAAVSGFSGGYQGSPVISGVYSLDDEPVAKEGSYVA